MSEKIINFFGIKGEWDGNDYNFPVIETLSKLSDAIKPEEYLYKIKENRLYNCSDKSAHFDSSSVETISLKELLRLIQSIPYKQAEPIKLWLAESGISRLNYDNNPDMLLKRAFKRYKANGLSEEQIMQKLREISIEESFND